MPTFDPNTKVPAFDLLTVLVMLEQCEPSLTMVEWVQVFFDPRAGMETIGAQQRCCMSCLIHRFSLTGSAGDGRARILNRIKDNEVVILSVAPISELSPCQRCNVIPGGNPHTLDNFLTLKSF